jgi:predicted transcriptional regulator
MMRNLVKEHYGVLSHLSGPRTPVRVAVLEELRSNGSMRKSELKRRFVDGAEEDGEGWDFTVSKPTLYRQFEDNPEESTGDSLSLVERGWVEDVSERRGAEARYAITPKGRLICESVESLFSTFEIVEDVQPELEPFLGVVTKSGMEMEADVLEELTDADIYSTTSTNFFGVYQEYIDFISEVDRIRGITWVWGDRFLESYYKFVVEEDKEVEFIFTPEVAEAVVENHTEPWKEMLETGNLTVIEGDIYPFGITIVEHGIAWGYFEPEKGAHEYELITESDVVLDWALDVFEKYNQEGQNVTEEQLEETKKRQES